MSVYMIIETLEIKDTETYSTYTSKAREIIVSYGGRYLASTDKIRKISGNWDPKRIVIIEFPDMEAFDTCFGSEEYKAITHLRQGSVTGKTVVVQG